MSSLGNKWCTSTVARRDKASAIERILVPSSFTQRFFRVRKEAHGIPGYCATLRVCTLFSRLHLQYCEYVHFFRNSKVLRSCMNCIPCLVAYCTPYFRVVPLLAGMGRGSESTTPRPNGVWSRRALRACFQAKTRCVVAGSLRLSFCCTPYRIPHFVPSITVCFLVVFLALFHTWNILQLSCFPLLFNILIATDVAGRVRDDHVPRCGHWVPGHLSLQIVWLHHAPPHPVRSKM